MKNILKNKPVKYVEGMNHIWSNGPKPRGDTVAQLNALKSWSQNPEAYYKKLKNSKYINNPKKLEAFIKSEDPVPRNAKEKQIKVVKKPKPKPQYLNGNVIDLKPLIHDPWWLIKPEKPEDEDTSIPIEEKIKRIAYIKELAENKLSGLNEEFVKQKLRERMS